MTRISFKTVGGRLVEKKQKTPGLNNAVLQYIYSWYNTKYRTFSHKTNTLIIHKKLI